MDLLIMSVEGTVIVTVLFTTRVLIRNVRRFFR